MSLCDIILPISIVSWSIRPYLNTSSILHISYLVPFSLVYWPVFKIDHLSHFPLAVLVIWSRHVEHVILLFLVSIPIKWVKFCNYLQYFPVVVIGMKNVWFLLSELFVKDLLLHLHCVWIDRWLFFLLIDYYGTILRLWLAVFIAASRLGLTVAHGFYEINIIQKIKL